MSGKKKLFAALMCLLLLCALCLPALAEEVGYIYYTWDKDTKVLTRHDDGTCTDATQLIYGVNKLSTGWYVAEGDITFNDFRPHVSGDVHLILKDGCKLTATYGITVNEGNSLTIYAQSEVEGMGALTVFGQDSDAGIGGESEKNSGLITIHGGTVTATTNGFGAAIGGGDVRSGTVTIYGGEITAITNGGGAAIGGGYSGSGTITIHGGTVTASALQNSYGAAIGGGGSSSGTVTIYGGMITAETGTESKGAAIGGGYFGSGTVTIHGGTVDATANGEGAAIGGSSYFGSGTVTIHGGTVTASALQNSYGAAIGGGKFGIATVTINGGKITAEAQGEGAGIGDGHEGSGSKVFLSWTDAGDFIKSDSYSGEVTLEKVFQYDDNGQTKYAVGEISDIDALGGKKLQPLQGTPNCTISASAFPADGGTVSDGGPHRVGTEVTVTATPNQGYRFVNWTEGETVVSTDAEYTFMVLEERTLTANFIPVYTVAVAAAPKAAGTVTGGGTYDKETEVTVSAKPNPGYRFLNWTDGAGEVSRDAEYSFTVAAERTLTANFEELPPFDKEHVNFIIPAGSIGANAFAGDEAIAIVDASQCTSLGEYAFRDCKGLLQIRVSKDCDIDDTAFEGCEALVAIYAPGGGTTQDSAEAAGIPFMPVE